MADYLTQEWLDLLEALACDLPARRGATARAQFVVTGAPAGEVRYSHSWVDGRLTEVSLGDDPGAEITCVQPYAVAQQVARREVAAEVTFMQGRMKVTGDMGRFMALMPLLTSDEYRAVLALLSDRTEY